MVASGFGTLTKTKKRTSRDKIRNFFSNLDYGGLKHSDFISLRRSENIEHLRNYSSNQKFRELRWSPENFLKQCELKKQEGFHHQAVKQNVSGLDYDLHIYSKGLWRVVVTFDSVNKFFDFSIQTYAVVNHFTHPELIEKGIVKKYGIDVYRKWKELILSDLESLVYLFPKARSSELIQDQGYVASYTCCDRSAKLCKRVGLEVVKDFAFLMV